MKWKLPLPSHINMVIMLIWSSEQKSIVVIELTVPWEEGCEEAHERKSAKYEELMEKGRERGWKTWLFPVEVG